MKKPKQLQCSLNVAVYLVEYFRIVVRLVIMLALASLTTHELSQRKHEWVLLSFLFPIWFLGNTDASVLPTLFFNHPLWRVGSSLTYHWTLHFPGASHVTASSAISNLWILENISPWATSSVAMASVVSLWHSCCWFSTQSSLSLLPNCLLDDAIGHSNLTFAVLKDLFNRKVCDRSV